jgi:hypothetical protein
MFLLTFLLYIKMYYYYFLYNLSFYFFCFRLSFILNRVWLYFGLDKLGQSSAIITIFSRSYDIHLFIL